MINGKMFISASDSAKVLTVDSAPLFKRLAPLPVPALYLSWPGDATPFWLLA